VVTLATGKYFGEKALLSQDMRAATCAASAQGCRCLMLNREDFNMMLGSLSELLAGEVDFPTAERPKASLRKQFRPVAHRRIEMAQPKPSKRRNLSSASWTPSKPWGSERSES
jgi:CRP-like cAMP-binding protein